jgi:hypothetical protein
MRSTISSLLISLWFSGCATSPCIGATSRAAQPSQRSCPGVYVFEFLALSPSAQLESAGVAVAEMPRCGVAETKPGGGQQRFGVRIAAQRADEVIVDAEVAGEQLHARLPVITDLRMVVDERWRADKGKVLVTLTMFDSQQTMRERMRARLARAGSDVGSNALPARR